MTRIHYYGIMQEYFTTLNILSASPIHPPLHHLQVFIPLVRLQIAKSLCSTVFIILLPCLNPPVVPICCLLAAQHFFLFHTSTPFEELSLSIGYSLEKLLIQYSPSSAMRRVCDPSYILGLRTNLPLCLNGQQCDKEIKQGYVFIHTRKQLWLTLRK